MSEGNNSNPVRTVMHDGRKLQIIQEAITAIGGDGATDTADGETFYILDGHNVTSSVAEDFLASAE